MIWSFVARSSANCAICCWPFYASKNVEVKWGFSSAKKIKTHGSVLCSPRKQGVCKQSEYIDRKNYVRHEFPACIAPWCLGWMAPNFTVELFSIQRTSHFQFEKNTFSCLQVTSECKISLKTFFSSFYTLCKNCYSLHMHGWNLAHILGS